MSKWRERYENDQEFRERQINNTYRARLKYLYGITFEEYEQMLISQEGLCAVCRQKEVKIQKGKIQRLSVDHDHITKQVRGLVCYNCNILIGHAKENPELLREAALYLERFL